LKIIWVLKKIKIYQAQACENSITSGKEKEKEDYGERETAYELECHNIDKQRKKVRKLFIKTYKILLSIGVTNEHVMITVGTSDSYLLGIESNTRVSV
jgi:hypothetical protein